MSNEGAVESESMSEVQEPPTDPNSNRLLEKVMDKLDGALFRQGFEFREDRDWFNAVAQIEKWIFKYYDDLTGGDSDYDPNKKSSASSDPEEPPVEDEEEEEDAEAEITLGSDTSDSDSPVPVRTKRQRE